MTWTYDDLIFKEPTEAKKDKMRRCIVLQSEGLSDAEIAKRLGYKNVISVSGLRVSRWFHQEAQRLAPQLQSPVGKKVGRLTEKDHVRIRQLHDKGLSNNQIAAAMPEWNPSTIQRHLKKLGLRPPKKAHLSDEEKTEIIRMREQGTTHEKIGQAIGRPPSTVSAFCAKHFGYSKYTPTQVQRLPEKREVSRNGTHEVKGRKLHHFRRGITFVPLPRRPPHQIAQEVKDSLQKHPTFCDTWHASRLSVVETLVSQTRSQLGIPTVRQLKKASYQNLDNPR